MKGRAPVSVELKFTRHGPCCPKIRAHRKAYALRAAWMEPARAPYLASLRMDQAKSWEEFREACTLQPHPVGEHGLGRPQGQHRLPGGGDHAAARVELARPGAGAGRRPLRMERLPADQRAAARGQPGQGATSRRRTTISSRRTISAQEALHYTGSDPYRASRISEALGSGRLHTIADMIRLQNDNVSLPARSLVPMLRGLTAAAEPAKKAQALLLAWNFSVDADSVAAGIYEMWQRRVNANIRNLLVPKEAQSLHRAAEHEAGHRLAAGARRPLRRGPGAGPRRIAVAQPRRSRRRADQEARSGPECVAVRARSATTTRSSCTRCRRWRRLDVRATLNGRPATARRRQLHRQRDRRRRQPDLRADR